MDITPDKDSDIHAPVFALLRDIAPCSCELNQYEQDVHEWLSTWLCNVTGIAWHMAYSEGAIPDENELGNTHGATKQYGTYHIESSEMRTPSAVETKPLGDAETGEACVVVAKRVIMDVELRVYNWANLPKNTCQTIITAADILHRIHDAYSNMNRHKTAFKDRCSSIIEFSKINNFTVEVKTGEYQRYSVMNIVMDVKRVSSYPETTLDGFSLFLS